MALKLWYRVRCFKLPLQYHIDKRTVSLRIKLKGLVLLVYNLDFMVESKRVSKLNERVYPKPRLPEVDPNPKALQLTRHTFHVALARTLGEQTDAVSSGSSTHHLHQKQCDYHVPVIGLRPLLAAHVTRHLVECSRSRALWDPKRGGVATSLRSIVIHSPRLLIPLFTAHFYPFAKPTRFSLPEPHTVSPWGS